MGMSVDGLSSGLDSTAIIEALMQVEAIPHNQLKNKVSGTQVMVNALQALNTRIADLAKLAGTTAKAESLNPLTASSNTAGVTATAGTLAAAGSLDFTVDSTARKQVAVSAAMTAWPDSPATLTLVASDGTKKEITATSTSLDGIVSAVNAAGAGVTALKVPAGTDGGGVQQYRLQFSSASGGADSAFQFFRGDAASVTAGTAVDVLTEPGAAIVSTAQDAQVTLWAGTPAAQTITSASNTFSGLLPGVDVTVTAAGPTLVTVTVARDDKKLTDTAKALVDSLNAVFAFVASNSAVTGGNDSTGGQKVTAGTFTGNGTVRDTRQSIFAAVAAPINGKSPAEIGINITKDGKLTFDADKFAAALAKDASAVQGTLQTMAGAVQSAATKASDAYTGTITTTVQGQQTQMRTLNDRILDWDQRLASRRSTLQRIYSNLEVTMSNMKAQQSWLSSQLGALPSNESGKK